MPVLYKICPASLWREAEREGIFRGSEHDRHDGFIHFSSAGQVAETAARHFAGQHDLLLIAVDADKLGCLGLSLGGIKASPRAAAHYFRICMAISILML